MVGGDNDGLAQKLGKGLTRQHPLAVYGMARSSTKIGRGFEITSSEVTAVRTDGCELRVTLCRGDLCEAKKSFYKFRTPLNLLNPAQQPPQNNSSPLDLERIIASEVINDVCAPNPAWLITDPLAVLILVASALLAYGTYIGADHLSDILLGAPRLEATIGAVFGSSSNFATAVRGAFWFTVVAHAFEASIAVYCSVASLKIGIVPTSLWAIMVFLVGYPVFGRFQKLLAIEHGHSKSK